MLKPIVDIYDGIHVVRDDLLLGGTKSRYFEHLFSQHNEVVYATPAVGGAQVALAACAQATGKKITLFTPQRLELHRRTKQAISMGANVIPTFPRYLNVLQSRARKYAKEHGAHYLEFGGDSKEAIMSIGAAAQSVQFKYGAFDQVWCAAGSGTLMRGLQAGLYGPEFYAVQIGKALTPEMVGIAKIIVHPLKYEQELKIDTPFPSCPNYDKKAWQICKEQSQGKVLFWNVMGD